MKRDDCEGCIELYGWDEQPECCIYDEPIKYIKQCPLERERAKEKEE